MFVKIIYIYFFSDVFILLFHYFSISLFVFFLFCDNLLIHSFNSFFISFFLHVFIVYSFQFYLSSVYIQYSFIYVYLFICLFVCLLIQCHSELVGEWPLARCVCSACRCCVETRTVDRSDEWGRSMWRARVFTVSPFMHALFLLLPYLHDMWGNNSSFQQTSTDFGFLFVWFFISLCILMQILSDVQ